MMTKKMNKNNETNVHTVKKSSVKTKINSEILYAFTSSLLNSCDSVSQPSFNRHIF